MFFVGNKIPRAENDERRLKAILYPDLYTVTHGWLVTIKRSHSGVGYSSDDNRDNEDLLKGGGLGITCQQPACKLKLCVTRLTTTLTNF